MKSMNFSHFSPNFSNSSHQITQLSKHIHTLFHAKVIDMELILNCLKTDGRGGNFQETNSI